MTDVSKTAPDETYSPPPCSPWRPASEPPTKDEWVVVSADGMARCVAWNNSVKRWEDWGSTGIVLDEIEWWMPIPDAPIKANAQAEGRASRTLSRFVGDS